MSRCTSRLAHDAAGDILYDAMIDLHRRQRFPKLNFKDSGCHGIILTTEFPSDKTIRDACVHGSCIKAITLPHSAPYFDYEVVSS
jgi:hypothetical protein